MTLPGDGHLQEFITAWGHVFIHERLCVGLHSFQIMSAAWRWLVTISCLLWPAVVHGNTWCSSSLYNPLLTCMSTIITVKYIIIFSLYQYVIWSNLWSVCILSTQSISKLLASLNPGLYLICRKSTKEHTTLCKFMTNRSWTVWETLLVQLLVVEQSVYNALCFY